jgi:hypothetical protein
MQSTIGMVKVWRLIRINKTLKIGNFLLKITLNLYGKFTSPVVIGHVGHPGHQSCSSYFRKSNFNGIDLRITTDVCIYDSDSLWKSIVALKFACKFFFVG